MDYLTGFLNYHQTEALSGALPKQQNSPQQLKYGLYAEQISGSAFTRPRAQNLRSWLYRSQPSVVHEPFSKIPNPPNFCPTEFPAPNPNQMRWDPLPVPGPDQPPCDFINSLTTWAINQGAAIHLYACNQSMPANIFFYNSDGELLIVPETGNLLIATEMGELEIQPKEIVVIPRGIKFQVHLIGGSNSIARGYILENLGSPLNLPELGPIGANGLANPNHFLYPTAKYHQQTGDFILINKYSNQLFAAKLNHHPLNVAAWHGNYAPFKYDLTKFNTINTVSFDHPDPSIFTVLTSASDTPGIANIDFVIFPARWMVATNTFRPPYFHRNIMSEYMGLIYGKYDAKSSGFLPGGSSLHNCMSAHGPDSDTTNTASNARLKPEHFSDTLAFMFESRFIWQSSEFAMTTDLLQRDYFKCWQQLHNKMELP